MIIDGRNVRFTSVVDAEAENFEKELLARSRVRSGDLETSLPLQLNLTQQTVWLKNSRHPFMLLQVRGADGQPLTQIAVTIYRIRGMKLFSHAAVHGLGCPSINHDEEFWALQQLPRLLRRSHGIMKLRLQAQRHQHIDLLDFEGMARRAGYRIVDPMAVTRTLVMDVTGEPDALLAALDKKTRAKVRHAPSLEKIEIRTLTEERWIPALNNAMQASFKRSTGEMAHLDFGDLLRVAAARPDLVFVQGLFFKHRPEELMAYSIVVRHGEVAESLSTGALSDPELRKIPYSYFLVWNRILWAHDNGAKLLDLGGVTDGAATDPLAGISQFKRHFTKSEAEFGREMELKTAPFKHFMFQIMSKGLERARL